MPVSYTHLAGAGGGEVKISAEDMAVSEILVRSFRSPRSARTTQNSRQNFQSSDRSRAQNSWERAVLVLNTSREQSFQNVRIQWNAMECSAVVEYWDAADGHTEIFEAQRDGQTESIVTDFAPCEMKLFLITQMEENHITSKTALRKNTDTVRLPMPDQYDYRLSEPVSYTHLDVYKRQAMRRR